MEKKNSTEQADKLTIELFGTPKEVREMAKTDREAHSYEEACTALREVVNKANPAFKRPFQITEWRKS
ncbi:hypothetical protein FACS189444_4480 [Spirochaetia bacterium]|nr:hypothetical protein FACS189444_4480 [Spirochaetia bacterium]